MDVLPTDSTSLSSRAAAESAVTQDVSIFGIPISNFSTTQAVAAIETALCSTDRGQSLYIVNAHTLNLACADFAYHQTLLSAGRVFGDGIGVRLAARQRGRSMQANLVGTDLLPALLAQTTGRGYRYFLLGADQDTIARAAVYCQQHFPGWELAGFHHGYVSDGKMNDAAVEAINVAAADLLLVGMGNPLQEQWIAANSEHLNVRLSIGVGGLFDHWGGNLNRAPLWVRKLGCEWVQLLLQDRHKARRYLLGNPLFLYRMWRDRHRDSELMRDRELARNSDHSSASLPL